MSLVGYQCAWGQAYIPLLGETNEWRVVSCDGGCLTDAYYTNADTTILGTVYKVLDGFHYIQGNFLIREDVQARKVYMKILATHTLLDEFPLYDFSLELGDTVDVYNPISPLPENGGQFVLDSIVARPLENGDHRFFYLHAVDPSASLSERTVWVEGVGSLRFINSPGALSTESNHLGCAFKDGQLQYADTDSIWSCGALSSNEREMDETVQLFPNPTHDHVQLQYNGRYTPTEVSIISMDGKVLASSAWNPRLELSNLAPSLYVVHVRFKEGFIQNLRLLVVNGKD